MIINVRLLVLVTFISVTGYNLVATATTNPTLSEPVSQRLMLHDFNRAELINNVGGDSESWTANSDVDTNLTTLDLSASERRGDSGAALKLSYSFDAETSAESGFRTHFQTLDATQYDHLELWVKYLGKQDFPGSFTVAFSKPEGDDPALIKHGSFLVTNVGNEWKRVRVPLNVMNGITDWTNVQSLSIAFHSRQADAKQGTYFFDDIALVKTGQPGPSVLDVVTPNKKKEWEQSLGGQAAARKQIWKRLVGWPSTLLVDKTQLPDDDNEFLKRLAQDTWKGLDALTDREHGLPLDTVRFGKDSVNPDRSRVGDYTNITNIGLYLLSVVAATDFEFITREEAIKKLDKTLITLGKLENFKGFYYNYYDTTTLERTSNFISFVDSSWLTAGLMVVRMAFPELYDRCTKLIEQGQYSWFYDDANQLMTHGYYVNLDYPSEYHYGLLYTESRVGSLIAIGKGEVPEKHWYSMARTLPAEFGWQSLQPISQKTKNVRGIELSGGYYEWNGLKYIPSWGGSLFEALMPTLVVDEKKHAPNSLGINNEIHATIHRRYALEELNYPVWGMSSSSMVAKDGYSEYGVKVLGSKGYKTGVISPHASALALNAIPKEAISNLRKLVELYDIYGEYGLYDAVEPLTGEVAPKYLALDQGMLFLSVANYLNNKSVQRYFESDPIAATALSILSEEKFFD